MARSNPNMQAILGAIAISISFCTLIAELWLGTSITIIVATVVVLSVSISLTMVIILRGASTYTNLRSTIQFRPLARTTKSPMRRRQ